MSARTRVYSVVAVAIVAAVAAVLGVVLTGSGGSSRAAASASPRGRPPLELDLGVRTDPEAAALRKAYGLYSSGHPIQAERIFSGYHSVEAQVGAAMAAWPDGTLERLGQLAAAHPHSSVARLNLGFALYWTGRKQQALGAWRQARSADPDTPAAVRAGDLLHPQYNRGLPTFVPSFGPPAGLSRLSPAKQFQRLARSRSVRDLLLYGVALQRLGRPLSAERVFARAAARAPDDPDAQVAAAVGRFDKNHPERAFSRLGPLTQRFPHAATVRFHLGLLLLWLGQVKEGERQLRLATAVEPGSPLAREAAVFLRKLAPRNRSARAAK